MTNLAAMQKKYQAEFGAPYADRFTDEYLDIAMKAMARLAELALNDDPAAAISIVDVGMFLAELRARRRDETAQ